jgi:hypothetical protein
MQDNSGAGAKPHNCDLLRISTKQCDVLSDPIHGLPRIVESNVLVYIAIRGSNKPECTESVVRGNENEWFAGLSVDSPWASIRIFGTICISAAVPPRLILVPTQAKRRNDAHQANTGALPFNDAGT